MNAKKITLFMLIILLFSWGVGKLTTDNVIIATEIQEKKRTQVQSISKKILPERLPSSLAKGPSVTQVKHVQKMSDAVLTLANPIVQKYLKTSKRAKESFKRSIQVLGRDEAAIQIASWIGLGSIFLMEKEFGKTLYGIVEKMEKVPDSMYVLSEAYEKFSEKDSFAKSSLLNLVRKVDAPGFDKAQFYVERGNFKARFDSNGKAFPDVYRLSMIIEYFSMTEYTMEQLEEFFYKLQELNADSPRALEFIGSRMQVYFQDFYEETYK